MTDSALVVHDRGPVTGEGIHPPSNAALLMRIAPPSWAKFLHFLQLHDLTTSALAEWTGRHVGIGALSRQLGPALGVTDGQHRQISLVARFDDGPYTLCRATAQVRLDALPGWARTVLTTTQLPLGRTLRRAGAVRDWTFAGSPAGDSAAADSAAADGEGGDLQVRGTFRLPSRGDEIVAVVEETFGARVPSLRAPDASVSVEGGVAVDRQVDDIDHEILRLIAHRRRLTSPVRPRDGVPPPAYAVHDDLLRQQLAEQFGRVVAGELVRAITRRSSPITTAVPPPDPRPVEDS